MSTLSALRPYYEFMHCGIYGIQQLAAHAPGKGRTPTVRSAAPRHGCSDISNRKSPSSARVTSNSGSALRKQLVTILAPLVVYSGSCTAAEVPPSPPYGSCTDCIGELNGTLNACTLNSASCVSSQNEDEDHFMAPWQYSSSTNAAVDSLVAVATGGEYEPALLQQPFGISRTDAVSFIVKGFQAALTGNRPPEKPKFQRDQSPAIAFKGTVVERHTAADGSAEYLHLVFGTGEYNEGQGLNVVDAEFLFLKDDNIVDLRASSRLKPIRSDGQLSLSLSKGVIYDQNLAQRQLERLRKALQWESVPVITGFDPRFNQDKPLFFEKLYQPFLRGNYKSSNVHEMR